MASGNCLLLRHLCMFNVKKGVREVIFRRDTDQKVDREVILRRGSQSESASGNPPGRSKKANAKAAHLSCLARD